MESNYAEENLSTEQQETRQKARLSGEDGDEERPGCIEAPKGKGPQASDGSALLSFSFPKDARLLKRAEFLRVYEHGKRFDGRFMTVFILPNVLGRHRAGITATKKAIGKAHDRNRAKRLLREAFRLSRGETEELKTNYDWVLNARRSILKTRLEQPLTEFREIAAKVKKLEGDTGVEA